MPIRRKPWCRARNVILAALVVVVAFVGYQVYLGVTATPGSAVDFQQKVVDLVESYQPAGAHAADKVENGWDVLQDAIRTLDEVEGQVKDKAGPEPDRPSGKPVWPIWPFDYAAIYDTVPAPQELLDTTRATMRTLKQRGLHDQLVHLAATPRAVCPKQQGKLIEVLLPGLGRSRQLARLGAARLGAARMYDASRAGDRGEQVAAFEQTLAVGRVCLQQFALIERQVGIAIHALALTELRSELAESPPDGPACRALLAALDQQTHVPPITLSFEGERLFILDTIQWTHTDDGRGSGRLLLTKANGLFSQTMGGGTLLPFLPDHPIINTLGIFFPSKARSVAKANEFYDGVVAWSESTTAQRLAGAAPDPAGAFLAKLPRGFFILQLLAPSFGMAMASDDQYRMFLAGTRLMLALETFKAEHGAYPKDLSELVPGVLTDLPLDPFSGKPFCYRLLPPGQDPVGRPYLLYSTGADGIDDGGRVDPDTGSIGALKPGVRGIDAVINEPRPPKQQPEP